MNPELKELLTTMGIGLIIGSIVGMAVTRLRPQWAKNWIKFCLNGQWKLFALAALFFGSGALWLWKDGQVYHAAVALTMCALELAALIMYGFRKLTPEMERKIDQSDLRRFWQRW